MATMKQDKEVLKKRNNTLDVRKEVWESGLMAVSVANMKRRGLTKSQAVEISGVPYEIIDRYYRADEPPRKGEKED